MMGVLRFICVLFGIAAATPGVWKYDTVDCSDAGTQYPLFTDQCLPTGPPANLYTEITCNAGGDWQITTYTDDVCANSVGAGGIVTGNNATVCKPTSGATAVKVNCTVDPFVDNGPTKIMIFLEAGCPGNSFLNASTTDACAFADDVFHVPGIGVYVKVLCSTDEQLATASIYDDSGCLSLNDSGQFPKGVCVPLPFQLSGVNASAIVKCGAGCLDDDACNYDPGFYTHNQTACSYVCNGEGCDNTTACNYNNPNYDECKFGDECAGSSLNPTFVLLMLLLVFAFFH